MKSIVKRLAGDLLGIDLVSNRNFGNRILRDVVRIVAPNSVQTVFDIGANRGDTTAEFANVFKDANLYSFEPDPTLFQELERRFATLHRVKLFPVGLGRSDEWRELTINKGPEGNSYLPVSPSIQDLTTGDWTVPVGKVRSRIRTLDAVCDELGIDRIDLIKIDTQGFEREVLQGGSQMIMAGRTRLVYLEVLFAELYQGQCYFDEIYSLLISRGFRFVGLYNCFNKTVPPHELLWCDALFVADGVK